MLCSDVSENALRNLFVLAYSIHHVFEYCNVIGPHSSEWWEECQCVKPPDHFPSKRKWAGLAQCMLCAYYDLRRSRTCRRL